MKRAAGILLILLLVMALTGCKDITDRFKPASFGNTQEEKAMVSALTEKYGDLTQGGEPRFLEARVTTKVNNFIPVDTVSIYSQDTAELYVWFVYDNFDEDEIEVEWVYQNNNHTIHTFTSETGSDFGRGTFILERPDDGWPIGNYQVVIRGRGISTTVTFAIAAGATVATPLEIEAGKVTLSPNPGWYFTSWDYIISSSDVTVVEGGRIEGRLAGSSGPGGILYDYYRSSGGKNDFSHSLERTNIDGKILHQGACKVTWTDPDKYLEPGKKTTIDMKIEVESAWGIGNKNVYFDAADLLPGYATVGKINFATPNGDTFLSSNYDGKLESVSNIPEAAPGSKRSIIVSLGNGYGFIYNYEWRE